MPVLSIEDISGYSRDGYIVRKNLLSSKEVALVRDRARASIEPEIREGKTRMVKTLTKSEEDEYGFLGRDQRLIDLAQDVIGKSIYRYRHTFIPNVGADDWHQDFAWGFASGFLAPQPTICVPLDRATRQNSCLRVLKGSHKLGLLNSSGVDHSIDQEQLVAALKRFELVYVEMDAGDVLVFDGNLLHGSEANRMDTRLWRYECFYNAVESRPERQHEPLENPARVWMGHDAASFSKSQVVR